MKLLHEPIKARIAEILAEALLALEIEVSIEKLYFSIAPTPNIEMGHFAFPCFEFAKILRLPPASISERLASQIVLSEFFSKVEAVGPYLNLFVNIKDLATKTSGDVISNLYFQRTLASKCPKTMIEYSQPNTHKELHVGHLRNMVLGRSLVELHRRCNYKVISATFPGDVGTHVAKVLWYYKKLNRFNPPKASKRGEWLGQMYVQATMQLDFLEGISNTNKLAKLKASKRKYQEYSTIAKGDDAIAVQLAKKDGFVFEKDFFDEIKAEMTNILKQLESGSGEYYQLWVETRKWSKDMMDTAYKWLNIKFDRWYWESDVDADSIKYVKSLQKEGKLIESDGAIGMDLGESKLGFVMFLKRDGTGLYATKDLELARRKFRDYKIKKSIYVVDNRQSHHFKQVFKALELLGFEEAKDCYHLAYEHVEGEDGPFSSRLGNAPGVMELKEAISAIVSKSLLTQIKKGLLKQKELLETADQIAKGAIIYGMLRIDPGKKIVFVLEDWLSTDGDSGPYLQYTHARIISLTTRLNFDPKEEVCWELLKDNREMDILVKISEFNDVIVRSVEQYRPNLVCAYLYSLAQSYNTLNSAIVLRDIFDPNEKHAKLALHYSVAMVLRNGLKYLGIPIPKRM